MINEENINQKAGILCTKDTSISSLREIRIAEAIANADVNIKYLANLSDRILSEKLNTIHIQMELAEQKRNTDSIEILEVWRAQVIEARIYKAENNIPDIPNSQ